MSREIKFRAWHKKSKCMAVWDVIKLLFAGESVWCQEKKITVPVRLEDCNPMTWKYQGIDIFNHPDFEVMQYTGLRDSKRTKEFPEGQEYYIGDIGEFDNGDRFVIKMESWLEMYIDWIGEPECEDQARDPYRIENAKNIGNIYQNPGLLT